MNVLVVAAHPDDEALGCGGAMAKHSAAGDDVHVVFLADGVTSRSSGPEYEMEVRAQLAQRACKLLGAHTPHFLELPDNRLDTVPLLDVVRLLEGVVEEVEPAAIYTHHGGDLNIDHRIAHQAVMTACRPQPGATVRAIYCFETLSSTEWASSVNACFRPNRFVNITDNLEIKLKALEVYEEEMRAFPHARSIEAAQALAKLRGAAVGLPAAEAFYTEREIVV